MNQMLAKFLRFQPRHSLSAFRVHAPCKRVISSVAATRQSLTQNVPPLRSSTFSRRCFSTEESGDFGPRGRRSTIAPTKTLFVGNIPYTCDDPDIREIFSPFGQITEIRIRTLLWLFSFFFSLTCFHIICICSTRPQVCQSQRVCSCRISGH
jgi:RNA recognition motif-containing protein